MPTDFKGFQSLSVSSLAEFLEALESANRSLGHTEYWYRGHTADYELTPKAFRTEHFGHESMFLQQIRNDAPAIRSDCPAFGDRVGWLMIARHYGVPTRILDWTESPMVALYFALETRDENCVFVEEVPPEKLDAFVWIMGARTLNQYSIGEARVLDSDHPVVTKLAAEAWDNATTSDMPFVVAFNPRSVDARVVAQRSKMTLHRFGGRDLCQFKDSKDFLRVIVIPAASRQRIFNELGALGLRRSMLYPDMEGLASEMRLAKKARTR